MIISPDRKRKAALDNRVLRSVARVLKRARRQQRVVRRVKRNRPELLPVSHHGLLGKDFVQGDFPLQQFVGVSNSNSNMNGKQEVVRP